MAHLNAYNSLLAIVKLEKAPEFEELAKRLENAKSVCLQAETPNQNCHSTSQKALEEAYRLYDKILMDYKQRLPSRMPSPTRHT